MKLTLLLLTLTFAVTACSSPPRTFVCATPVGEVQFGTQSPAVRAQSNGWRLTNDQGYTIIIPGSQCVEVIAPKEAADASASN